MRRYASAASSAGASASWSDSEPYRSEIRRGAQKVPISSMAPGALLWSWINLLLL